MVTSDLWKSHLCLRPPIVQCWTWSSRDADWLLEQSATRSHWLLESMEVESAYSSHGCFREWLAIGGEKDRFSCLFLLFYGLIVGKYALICTVEIQKIHTVILWLYHRVKSLFTLLTANNVPFDSPTNECMPWFSSLL